MLICKKEIACALACWAFLWYGYMNIEICKYINPWKERLALRLRSNNPSI